MSTWILLVLVHVGAFGDGNSNSLTSVPGFEDQASCETAGKQALALTVGVKSVRTVCIEQPRKQK